MQKNLQLMALALFLFSCLQGVSCDSGSGPVSIDTPMTLEDVGGSPEDTVRLPDEACEPACEGLECGDDGCGGTCGGCEDHFLCEDGGCVYQPYCGDGSCDIDLGESCEICADDCGCDEVEVCVDGACCAPESCTSLELECGPAEDGCGESLECGECIAYEGSFCSEDGICDCEPACEGMECGDDHCGGFCGECGVEEVCSDDSICVQVTCDSDLDCVGFGKVCDPLTEHCVVCLTPADCGAGDFICKEKFCVAVTPCQSSLDCQDQVCDAVAGFCVDCLEDADCDGDAICSGVTCIEITPCDSSLDCTAQVCDLDLGYCVDCTSDADCGENSNCTDIGKCEQFTPCDSDLDCTPLGLLCDKDAGKCVECLSNANCPEVYHCLDSKCMLDVCIPGTGSCDGVIAVECLDDGSGWGNPTTCGAEQYCDNGQCFDWVCIPDEVYCEGNFVKTCNSSGSDVLSEVNCTEAAICLVATCIPIVCEPTALKCLGNFTYSQCNLTGTEWGTDETCPFETYCDEGLCLQQVCEPEAAACADESTVEICNENGSGIADTVPCVASTTCLGGECVPVVCGSGTMACIGGDAATCNGTGTDYIITPCGDDQYCFEAGDSATCEDQVCEPGTNYCNGSVIMLCDGVGASGSEVLDCDDADNVCQDGVCSSTLVVDGRWMINGDGTVTDLETNLIWDQNGTIAPYLMFPDAEAHCSQLSAGGFNDWRLPNVNELRSLIVGCPVTETGGACVTSPTSCSEGQGCIGCANFGGAGEGGLYLAANVWPPAAEPLKYWSGPECGSLLSWVTYANRGSLYPQWAKSWEHPARAWCVREAAQSCDPGTYFCEGSVQMLCDETGTGGTEVLDCADSDMACTEGACVVVPHQCSGPDFQGVVFMDHFEGTALSDAWDQDCVGTPPEFTVSDSSLNITDAAFSGVDHWLNNLSADLANQMCIPFPVEGGNFDVETKLSWETTTQGLLYAGVGIHDANQNFAVLAGVWDAWSDEPQGARPRILMNGTYIDGQSNNINHEGTLSLSGMATLRVRVIDGVLTAWIDDEIVLEDILVSPEVQSLSIFSAAYKTVSQEFDFGTVSVDYVWTCR